MTTLADQLMAMLDKRLPKAFEEGGRAMANMIADQMEENTEKGRAFGNDIYVNEYSPRSIAERSALGLQTGTVVLRRGNNRIETTRVDRISGKGASIRFEQGGRIFNEHHTGEALKKPFNRNVPIRSIFPKTHESVPRDIIEDTKIVIAEVLIGG
jgi:hypothetical protein